jgi:ADP-dependent phosphofructokinase/glucokinase
MCGLFVACYAFFLYGGNAMSTAPEDPTHALLCRFNQNIMALDCAIEEIAVWIDQRGSADVSDQIDDHLAVITENSDFIAKAIADLRARWTPEEVADPD